MILLTTFTVKSDLLNSYLSGGKGFGVGPGGWGNGFSPDYLYDGKTPYVESCREEAETWAMLRELYS